jgi:hypothetical protein
MIIGLTGFKSSGKDVAGAYLVKQHDFERRAFADPLKRSLAALLDIPFSEIEKLKNDANMCLGMGRVSTAGYLQPRSRVLSFRELLQRYGTESHRDVFGPNFWIDQTLPLSPGRYIGRKIVVTDVRFPNEVARLRHLNGIVVRIDRPVQPLETEGQFVTNDTNRPADLKGSTGLAGVAHSSETLDFEPDYTVTNDSDITTLYGRIETMLNAAAQQQFVQTG